MTPSQRPGRTATPIEDAKGETRIFGRSELLMLAKALTDYALHRSQHGLPLTIRAYPCRTEARSRTGADEEETHTRENLALALPLSSDCASRVCEQGPDEDNR